MTELTKIKGLIYNIRNKQVMLDRDLAKLYGVETRVLNQAVKRNIERFPEDFMFQLHSEELDFWKSQIVISDSIKKGLRRMPFAFTELGVAMLSSVLNSQTAIQINIGIMRAFVATREAVSNNVETDGRILKLEKRFDDLKADLEEIFTDYNDINEDTRVQIELLKESLAELQTEKLKRVHRPKVGFIPSKC